MISFFDFFLRSEEFEDDVIMDSLDHASRLSGEIPDLDKDIFFLLGALYPSIEVLEDDEVFVESFSIVFLEIGIEDESSFLDKKPSLFPIDELAYMFLRLRGLHE